MSIGENYQEKFLMVRELSNVLMGKESLVYGGDRKFSVVHKYNILQVISIMDKFKIL